MSGRPVKRKLSSVHSLLDVHRRFPERWPFLLASSATAERLGRWSLLLRVGDEAPLMRTAGDVVSGGPGGHAGFLDGLKAWAEMLATGLGDVSLPFVGGWFIYLGYELAGEIEPRLNLPAADDGLPVALARRCRAALLYDHAEAAFWLVAEDELELEAAAAEIAQPAAESADALPSNLHIDADPGADFTAGVERIKRYIRAGDVFQVNLSRAWRAYGNEDIDPAALYEALSRSNPAPFAALARLPGGTLVSSSPERLVTVHGREVQTRPIAGTRPRGGSAAADRSLSDELVSHPKERAEHIMLIDLERNDLGRVCETGSVEVDELMVVESYAHVHHIVSNVRGRLEPGTGAAEVIAAVFPGGTITGCPKVRCMEIIAELEGRGRSFYTGALGYLGRDGRLDLNILIRSMVVQGESIGFRTGAGIVADSDPQAELAETEDKARGLLAAIRHD